MPNKNFISETVNIKSLAILVRPLFIETEILKLKKTPHQTQRNLCLLAKMKNVSQKNASTCGFISEETSVSECFLEAFQSHFANMQSRYSCLSC